MGARNFFPEKFSNFHKCPLNAVTIEYAPAVMPELKHPNGSFEVKRSDLEIIRGLSSVLNFQLNVTFLPEYGSWGVIFDNGTSTGAKGIRMVVENILLHYTAQPKLCGN